MRKLLKRLVCKHDDVTDLKFYSVMIVRCEACGKTWRVR